MSAGPGPSPLVSILLPTYNRAAFLPAAFASIRGQTLVDWELIVIDDGSSDDTGWLVREFAAAVPQRVVYERQENAGPYAARNRALDLASAPQVAFFDSDDVWLPEYLAAMTQALDAGGGVDWAYAACRIVDYRTGAVLSPDTFRLHGRPRPFIGLGTRPFGGVRVFDDGRVVEWALRHGLYAGLQNSVIRRSVFEHERFRTAYRNEAEDQLFLIRALKGGRRVGYVNRVLVQYHVHDANSSASATDRGADRRLRVHQPVARGFEDLLREYRWSGAERRALRQRLMREHFWHIGYAIYLSNGRRAEAIRSFRTGLRYWPWNLACWKTYGLARLRAARR